MTTTQNEVPGAQPFSDLDVTAVGAFDASTGTLAGSRCEACGTLTFPRAFICFACLSDDVVDERLVAEGNLYSFTTIHISPTFPTPYSIGYVDLDSGVRVLGQLTGAAQQCDTRVVAVESADSPTGWAFTAQSDEHAAQQGVQS